MKSYILTALRLTSASILLVVIYTAIVAAMAQLTPERGAGEMFTDHGHTWYANIGQKFTEDRYFNSRPSAVGYNASASGGSNKGPYNPEYLIEVHQRIDSFLAHNPRIKRSGIPADLVTASGSGLDPDISVAAAMVQVPRIAAVRGIDRNMLYQLIAQHTEHPFGGLCGPEKINVLKLNIALNNL